MTKEVPQLLEAESFDDNVRYYANTLECLLRLRGERRGAVSESMIESVKERLRIAIEAKVSYEQQKGGDK
jgi:di/tripeptidase